MCPRFAIARAKAAGTAGRADYRAAPTLAGRSAASGLAAADASCCPDHPTARRSYWSSFCRVSQLMIPAPAATTPEADCTALGRSNRRRPQISIGIQTEVDAEAPLCRWSVTLRPGASARLLLDRPGCRLFEWVSNADSGPLAGGHLNDEMTKLYVVRRHCLKTAKWNSW